MALEDTKPADEVKPADEGESTGEEAGAETPAPASGPRRISWVRLAILIGPVVLLIGGGGIAFVLGMLDPWIGGGDAQEAKPAIATEAIYFDLPEMLVNLNSAGGRRANYLRVVVSLEVGSKEDLARIEQVKPRIVDNFQLFLRELRAEDLRGSAGMYRLKEELLTRANESAKPVPIKDVLFREMLVQ